MAGFAVKPFEGVSFNTVLITVALIGGVISVISGLLTFIAGTAISHTGGREGVLLKDLALVSFDGIIANNDTSEFLVHLYWFVNAFAWEYPDAPDGIPKAGIASTGLHFRADILGDLHGIADQLQVPKGDYDCPRLGSFYPSCKNIFFEAWRSYLIQDGLPLVGWLTWIMLISALVIGTLAMAQEWMIRKRPYWMRCRCIFLKRFCPCPKGTREEIEKLDDYFWDKVRASYWGLVAAYFLLPAAQATFASMFFIQWMGYLDDRLPKGFSMGVRRDLKGEGLLWAAFFSSTVSALCMLVKWRMSRRPKGWIEEQHMPPLEREGPGNNGRYTD
ncbi:hypothetical protein B0T10DRAFT_470691 [Thelonectria olida]|uniref:Uncharacterized protein n=1 Tax=Thelonectria olida TaxID=1576542 RepID=A0A9P9AWG9_9HYPO|nr:hypothetical protein B0T10DRAFT_470691 [Thelonectria olida]